jgi:hypothetical protein
MPVPDALWSQQGNTAMQYKQDSPQYLRLSLAPRFEGFDKTSAAFDKAHRRWIAWTVVTMVGLLLSAIVLVGM